MNRLQDHVLTVALAKGQERYVIVFDESETCEAMRTIGRWASNPELSFSWYDAARLSAEIRNRVKQ